MLMRIKMVVKFFFKRAGIYMLLKPVDFVIAGKFIKQLCFRLVNLRLWRVPQLVYC